MDLVTFMVVNYLFIMQNILLSVVSYYKFTVCMIDNVKNIDIIKSIQDNNMIFVTGHPDTVYFHWQTSLYLYQFSKHGIIDNCYAIFGYSGDGPSEYITNLSKKYPNIKWYKDDRKDRSYIPTIRPHLFSKFFSEYPQLGKNAFCHDSDILLVDLPRFDLMLNDDVSYLSNTVSYLGYNYIRDCCTRYKNIYPELPDDDLFIKMCDVTGIDPNIVKSNQQNAGGAQLLLKNVTSDYWTECENKCNELYSLFKDYTTKYPIEHHIQIWTAEMWAVLWVYWKHGGTTKIHDELDFSWATDYVDKYFEKNIFHLAGVNAKTCSDKFYKAKYNRKMLFDEYIKDDTIFNHIDPNNATSEYAKLVVEYIDNVYAPDKDVYKKYLQKKTEDTMNKNNSINRFQLINNKHWTGLYTRDKDTTCCGKDIWRSVNKKYIIFYNSKFWIVTSTKHENDIGKKCGGYASTLSDEPFVNNWNISCEIKFL